jgi:hypothetical protein
MEANMRKSAYLLATVALVLLPSSLLRAESPWIHVQVREHDGNRAKVNVNLPLSVVQVAMAAAPEKIISDGHIHIDHHGRHHLSISDLRRIWQELRDSGEAHFVEVEDDQEKVNVFREGDTIRIEIEDLDDDPDRETVNVKVPIAVVDALFSGEGDELNIGDALDLLKDQRGEIVRVEGGDADVRIWIDERSSK